MSASPSFHHALNLIIHSKLKIYNIIYITDMFINILTFSIMFSTAFLHKIQIATNTNQGYRGQVFKKFATIYMYYKAS